MIPRSVRNDNPGNIDVNVHENWLGQVLERDMTAAQKSEPRFVVFASPQMGFRALVILLNNYQKLDGCDTVYKLISRLAPSTENPTFAYASTVAFACDVKVDDKFDITVRENAFNAAKAIAKVETGSWAPYWTDEELDLGIGLTGLYPAPAQQVAA